MISRLLIGPPLPTSAAEGERLSKAMAMGAFGLDALSSVAYGPDEILYVLILAGAVGTRLNMPIALAIAALLAIVAVSYRQTIFAYPRGGGSYTVARENLGIYAGLIAAAALMVDYLTTVAVSVTAGIEAIVAFVPAVEEYRVIAGVGAVVLLTIINLRGVREAGAAFIIPTYLFIGSLAILVAVGVFKVATGFTPESTTLPLAAEDVSLFLVLRAFAGGCTAMTGVEAIANGVPAFKEPRQKNAAATLMILASILGVLFLGVAWLGVEAHAIPSDQASIVAQIGTSFLGAGNPLFYVVQLSSAVVLLLAANTSFNGFPRLAAIMSEDDYFPHQFSHRGQRLAYSNGIVVIAVLAIVLIVAFGGSTHALIPMFAVGVFMCFTLSQTGMLLHWLRGKEPGYQGRMVINAAGAVITAAVTCVVVATKFREGAWIVLLLIPLLVALFVAMHRHYFQARSELFVPSCQPDQQRRDPHILVPVRSLDRATASAIEYATSISNRVTAVHIAVDEELADRFRGTWDVWAPHVPLKIVPSPYREVVAPLIELVHEERAADESMPVTVVLPEVVPHFIWEEPLHNQLGIALQVALRAQPGVVVTSVPVRLHC